MKKYLYKASSIIFVLNIVAVILSYFWIHSDLIIQPMILATMISFGMFVLDNHSDTKSDLWDIIYVGGSIHVIIIALICILYFFVSFMISFAILHEGGPEIVDGIYYLSNHGSIVHQISESEYYKLLLAERRLFSAALLPFSSIALAYWSSSFKRNDFS